MKKIFGFIFAFFAMLLLSVSCSKVVKDKTSGLVDEINDSVMVLKIDGSKVHFDVTAASFTHGAVMYGDSVIVHYTGDLSKKRALAEAVYLIERPGTIVEVKEGEIDSTKELLTRPAEAGATEAIDNLIRLSKSQRHAE
ncbi:MAG: hypothetical protein II864_09215 [Prevotella sp.]|nr:hypothetical protein [Prevotella sp.]